MTSINTSYNSSYYQLFGQQTQTAQTNGTSSIPSLADVLSQSDNANATNNSAYLLDLSPEAQAYMNSQGSSSSSSSSDANANFTLTPAQQKQFNDIIAKYADAPYTQDTFNQIQDDLKAAGLGADQLSLQDQIKSFNATSLLISDLNGTDTDIVAQPTANDEQTKTTNYMQSVMSQWQNTSTTYNADTTDVSAS